MQIYYRALIPVNWSAELSSAKKILNRDFRLSFRRRPESRHRVPACAGTTTLY